jgi:NAD(P)H-dependent FMN reductase
MQRKIDLTLIYGSARAGRLCDKVANWVAAQIEQNGNFTLDKLDPANAHVAAGVEGTDKALRLALRHRIGAAEAFVIVTPEYNHSYPAPLKALIDTANVEWHAKPVAFVSYGGGSGGVRAVEHLRGVFVELHAACVRDMVSFPGAWNRFDDNGLIDPEGHERAARAMLARLNWWAQTLRQGRAERPYAEAVA